MMRGSSTVPSNPTEIVQNVARSDEEKNDKTKLLLILNVFMILSNLLVATIIKYQNNGWTGICI
jgi:hypothetical protein